MARRATQRDEKPAQVFDRAPPARQTLWQAERLPHRGSRRGSRISSVARQTFWQFSTVPHQAEELNHAVEDLADPLNFPPITPIKDIKAVRMVLGANRE